ncbi:universal stress protein [Pseudonocardia sp. CA-107938]|uniref:universal stress protein n=1 Tax=Pseudonocardia sp. CA-107938 TaxID=3240021 RepID=UPI003D8AE913
MDEQGTADGAVVVGVDGSPSSRAALDHALREARRRGARVRVVAVARLPECWAGVYGLGGLPTPREVAEGLRASVTEEVAAAVAAAPDLGSVPVTIETFSGAPGPALVEAAEGADLLVLGHRGRGAVRSSVMGSVGLHCVLHATCPVTIVRVPATAPADEPALVAGVTA